jgi:antitoxin (DNA-binding transcriptional repressor) of toxin-antitoxin stability system
MREVSLREFRTRGAKALEAVPEGEVVLLSGQQGPAYYLVPVKGDLAVGDRELRRAMAITSLEESWRQARVKGYDKLSSVEINAEISRVRKRSRAARTR